MDDATHSNQFNEIDMTLSYDKDLGPVCLGASYSYYGLDGINDSEEIYLSIAVDTILSPTLTAYRETAHLPSWYLSFAVSHSFELPKDITLDMAGSLGYYYADNADDFAEYIDFQIINFTRLEGGRRISYTSTTDNIVKLFI